MMITLTVVGKICTIIVAIYLWLLLVNALVSLSKLSCIKDELSRIREELSCIKEELSVEHPIFVRVTRTAMHEDANTGRYTGENP